MRKNKLMRAAAGLMVATLLTTSIISGTLAKYTVSKKAGDTARVAKFGVAVAATGETFAKEYTGTGSATTVASSTEDKVVAPGTSKDMASITITGKPEVAVKVSYAGNFELGDNWTTDNKDFYCPLKVTVKSTSGTTVIEKKTSKTEFETAVNDAIKAYSKTYDPNTDLSKQGADNLTVSWEWAFDGDDAKDTALGKAAAEDKAGTVSLQVTTTVTQID